MLEQRMTIIGLGVSSLEKATDFYESIFGWKKMDSSNEYISFFKLNGFLLSLYPKNKLAEDATVSPEGSGFKSFSLAYNTRSEKEVDNLIHSLKLKGVKIVKEPQKTDWGGYSSYVADLDENLWEIAYNPFLPLNDTSAVL